MRGLAWTVVVPVKRLPAAKTRLRGGMSGVDHDRLALAFAGDTVAAALAAPPVARVVVVTDDPTVGLTLKRIGAFVIPDAPDAGLNAAVTYGAGFAGPGPVAALTADLPALRPADLTGALTAGGVDLAGSRWFVPDTPATGTVLLGAAAAGGLRPLFGPGSAAAHQASGATALAGDWPTLRRDVDTAADLVEAATLGLGPHTRAALAGTVLGMQGTVATYDADTRSGTMLLDDGSEVAFGAAAFDAGGLRLLRLGQRLRIEHDAAGQVSRVTLPTFP